ncbi:MAG: ATP synthase F1 subunit delta [Patescibacteria group bacterium]|jgi:F-type H+-transporting ATPase subunit delta
MKVTAKQYAQALFRELEDRTPEETSKIIFNFLEVLKNDNCLSQIEKIISYFEVFWQKEHSVVQAEITSSRKLEIEPKEEIIKFLKKISKSEKIEVSEKEDKNIIGGFILKYNDKIFDASIKNRINLFKNSLRQ